MYTQPQQANQCFNMQFVPHKHHGMASCCGNIVHALTIVGAATDSMAISLFQYDAQLPTHWGGKPVRACYHGTFTRCLGPDKKSARSHAPSPTPRVNSNWQSRQLVLILMRPMANLNLTRCNHKCIRLFGAVELHVQARDGTALLLQCLDCYHQGGVRVVPKQALH